MDKELLKEVLSIPTCFGKEERVREFLINYGVQNNIPVKVDVKGNVYLVKGFLEEGETYPCVVAHMDTVHFDQQDAITDNTKLIIHEEKTELGVKLWASIVDKGVEVQTGIGGDDKAGLFICLELLKKYDKIIGAFFVEEEFGCKGSSEVDKEILKDVGYFIQFDAPFNNWCSFTCSNVQLFDSKLFNKIKPTLFKYGQTHISNDPYTDVLKLKEFFDVACMNFFAGYYNMHTASEFVIVESVEKAVNMGNEMINVLGLDKQPMKHKKIPNYDLYIKIQNWTKNN